MSFGNWSLGVENLSWEDAEKQEEEEQANYECGEWGWRNSY